MAEATDFVRYVAMAWKNLAAYPPGHPTLETSLQTVRDTLSELSAGEELVYRVTSDKLYFGDRPVDIPHAQKFAHALYRRGVARIRFRSPGGPGEVDILLRLLGVGQQVQPDQPLWDALAERGVSSIELEPVDYSGIRVTDELDGSPPKEKQRILLHRILQTLDIDADLALEQEDLDPLDLVTRSVRDAAGRVSAFDPDATFGVGNIPLPDTERDDEGERVATELLRAAGTGEGDSIEEVLRLLRALPSDVRVTILRAMFHQIATEDQGEPLLQRLASELPDDEIIEALRRVSHEAKLSTPAMLLLQSLTPVTPKVEIAEVSQDEVEAIATVFGDEDADRFNPSEHQALLEATSVQLPSITNATDREIEALRKRLPSVDAAAVEAQLEEILFELLPGGGAERTAVVLERLDLTVQQMLERSRFGEVAALLDRMQEIVLRTDDPEVMDSIHEYLQELAQVEIVLGLVDRLPHSDEVAKAGIQQVLEKLGSVATRNLIAALVEEEDRARRRRLFSLLASMGTVIAQEVRPYLTDPRWHVVRTMLGLLKAVEDRSLLAEMRKLALSTDLRVRLEALETLLTLEASVPRHLLEAAIFDRDPKVAEAVITLSGTHHIVQAMEPLLSLLAERDLFRRKRSLRLKAIQTLGELGRPEALPGLDRFLRDSFLPWPPRAERYAVWRSLAGYPQTATEEILERGARSRDRAVRRIVSDLRGME
jgi:hypothetical protein